MLPLGDEPSKRAGKNPKQDSQDYPIEGEKITSQTGEVGIVRRSPDMDSLKTELKVSHAGTVVTQQLNMGSATTQQLSDAQQLDMGTASCSVDNVRSIMLLRNIVTEDLIP